MASKSKFTADAFGDDIASKPTKSKSHKQDSAHQQTNPVNQPMRVGQHDDVDTILKQNAGLYESDAIEDKELEAFIGWDTVKNTKKEKAEKRKQEKAAAEAAKAQLAAAQQSQNTDETTATQPAADDSNGVTGDSADVSSSAGFADNAAEQQHNKQATTETNSKSATSPPPAVTNTPTASPEPGEAKPPVRGLSNAANNVLTSHADSAVQRAQTATRQAVQQASDAAASANSTVQSSVQSVVDNVVHSADDLAKLIHDTLAALPDKTLSLAHVGDRITAQTKQSWSKAYKKQFGSLRDFVTSRSDQFSLSNEDNVEKLSIKQPEPPVSASKAKRKKKKKAAAVDDESAVNAEPKSEHTGTNGTSTAAHTSTKEQSHQSTTQSEPPVKAMVEQVKAAVASADVKQKLSKAERKAKKTVQTAVANGRAALHDANQQFDDVRHNAEQYIQQPPQTHTVAIAAVGVVVAVLIGVTVMKYVS